VENEVVEQPTREQGEVDKVQRSGTGIIKYNGGKGVGGRGEEWDGKGNLILFGKCKSVL